MAMAPTWVPSGQVSGRESLSYGFKRCIGTNNTFGTR